MAVSCSGDLPGVISVSATDFNNQLAPYSNFGEKIDIAAPGGDMQVDLNHDGNTDGILSTLVDDTSDSISSTFRFYQGTSMAAPHVAGVIALMKAVYPSLTPSELDTLLAEGRLSNDLGTYGRDNTYGHGFLNALKAVQSAQTLANNGELPPLPALFAAAPTSLTLGLNSSSLITISNTGDQTAFIQNFNSNSTWLKINQNIDVNNKGLGTYVITIDRTGLIDSQYSGKITFNLSNDKSLEVQVSMTVGSISSQSNMGTQYVFLFDTNAQQVIDVTTVDNGLNADSQYVFKNVSPGTYQIVASSDIDNDFSICQLGESCGAYPVLSKISDIQVLDKNIPNLDFVTSVLYNFRASNLMSQNIETSTNYFISSALQKNVQQISESIKKARQQ